jgi:hypothetical protein
MAVICFLSSYELDDHIRKFGYAELQPFIFVVPAPVCRGSGQRPSQPANSRSSEIQAVDQTAAMCRIETFGSAGGAEALSDEFIRSYGLATRARKTATTARKTAMTARRSATAARKTATAARKTATAARKTAMTARKTATTARKTTTAARNSATTARKTATAPRNSATAARNSATTARRGGTGAVPVTTKAGFGVYTAGGARDAD